MTMLDKRTQTSQSKPSKNSLRLNPEKKSHFLKTTATDVLNKESTQFVTITEPRIVLVNLTRPIV